MDLDDYLEAIRAGDRMAFGSWASRAESQLRGALRSLADRVDTESVVQETLLRVWLLAGDVEPRGPNSLLRFAVRMARNLAISELRRKGREVPLPGEEGGLAPPAGPGPPDYFQMEKIWACVKALSAKPRAAMTARLRDGGACPDRDLARRVGMSLNTFHQNIGRARGLLRDCLRQYGIGGG